MPSRGSARIVGDPSGSARRRTRCARHENSNARTDMRRTTILATLVAALAVLPTTARPADAAVSSASIVGGVATLNLDGADDNVTVSVSGGLFVHGQATGGLNS